MSHHASHELDDHQHHEDHSVNVKVAVFFIVVLAAIALIAAIG